MENYPEFRSRSGQVSKHVTLLSELNRMIDKRRLMTASMHEQELACSSNMTGHHTEVMTLLNDSSIDENNKLRLVMLFALRYEQVRARSFHPARLCLAMGSPCAKGTHSSGGYTRRQCAYYQ